MSSTTLSIRSKADLLALYRQDDRVARITDALKPDSARVQISGTVGSSQALIASSVIAKHPGVYVFVLTDREEAAYFMNDLEALEVQPTGTSKGATVPKGIDRLFYPAPMRSPYDAEGHHDGERVTRTEVLEALMSSTALGQTAPLVIITYPDALVPLVVAKEVMQKNTLAIKRGEELPIDTLEEWFQETGFQRVEFVYEPGQFSIRGGIVDVFSYGNDRPYRIELYGDCAPFRPAGPADRGALGRSGDRARPAG